jgi:hypothetical protein
MKPPEASSAQICGPVTALTAPARKPAVIIRDMLVKNQAYAPPTPYLFSGRKKKTQTSGLGKKTSGYIWPQTGRPRLCNTLKISMKR